MARQRPRSDRRNDESDLLRAADQFGASWVVLDENRPEPLAPLVNNPNSNSRLRLRAQFGAVILLEIMPN